MEARQIIVFKEQSARQIVQWCISVVCIPQYSTKFVGAAAEPNVSLVEIGKSVKQLELTVAVDEKDSFLRSQMTA